MRVFLAGKPLHRNSRPHWLIIFAFIESSALYTFNVIAALATFQSKSFAQYVAVDSLVPIVVSVRYILLLLFDWSLTHRSALGHLFLSRRASDSLPCQHLAAPTPK